jgi:hypothetical protein
MTSQISYKTFLGKSALEREVERMFNLRGEIFNLKCSALEVK